jgi:signal transduction histidine kinase
MTRPRVLSSAAFRLALVFAALFAVGAAVLVTVFDNAVKSYAERSTLASLHGEVALLQAKAVALGSARFRDYLERRQQTEAAEHYRYLLLDRQGRRVAGDLPASVSRAGLGAISLPEKPDPEEAPNADGLEEETGTVRTMGVQLPGGLRLVVGRETYALQDLTRWVDRVAIWSGAGIVVLALLSGYLISVLFVRRLETVNVAAGRIMAGKLNERLPTIGLGDEFSRLSANLNLMLDRIEALMEGLQQVSTDIAHDLRTPLTRLRQTLEAARSSGSLEVHEHATEAALAQLDRVLVTFNALLRIGLIEAGRGRDRFDAVDISELMDRIWQAYQPAAEDAGKMLAAEIEPGVQVHGDAELLAQLFVNLVENAIRHSGDAATVTLRLERRHGQAVAAVCDRGPGVPAEERQKVLRRFYRLESSRTTPGAGLGLALVSAIAALHGADFSLDDNRPGVCATLRLTLLGPDVQPGPRPTPVQAEAGEAPARAH